MIVINASPGRDYDKRLWNPTNIVHVVDYVMGANGNESVSFVGTNDQRLYADVIIENCYFKNDITNLCGNTTISQLGVLVRDATLVITVNTMPMHLASALNVPFVAIVDATSAEVVAHPNVRRVIMPCTVDEVMEAVEGVLNVEQ